MPTLDATVRWIFDALPPSGARRGGDPSEHAFRHDLETFVREVIQNANDQAVDPPRIRFTFSRLTGDELAEFQRTICWDTLLPHLQAAGETPGGQGITRALAEMASTGRLLLLHVEDHHTVGLTGDESGGASHFTALCKDTLYSHKPSERAGGKFGLGKSVLWRFSGLSTVVFGSMLIEDPPGLRSPRLIGRAELPSHGIEDAGWFTGSGWFGRRAQVKGGSRAESVWDEDARALSRRLSMARSDETGTSILVVGFRDPASDEELALDQLALRIRAAATRYFWPAMTMEARRLAVSVRTNPAGPEVEARIGDEVHPFVTCYRNRGSTRVALDEPGDIVVRQIPIAVPAQRDGTRGHAAQADLVVRLAAEQADDPLLGHVALFRGCGMVVRYWSRSSLALESRPFHAALICGEARRPEAPSAGDRALDAFLRHAEPPGHDEWTTTTALKEIYAPGYAKALKGLLDQATAEIRRLVVAQPAVGQQGPDRLKRRFPIGQRGGPGSEPSAFYFSGLGARFSDNRWEFEGEVRPAVPGAPWSVQIRMHEVGEDGRPIEEVPILEMIIESDGGAHSITDGIARIQADRDIDAVAFLGTSAPMAPAMRGELQLEVTGSSTGTSE